MNTETTISQKIIQILLFEGGNMKKIDISKVLGIKEKDIEENIQEVKKLLSVIGLNLLQNQNSLEISLSSSINEIISKAKMEELKVELSESALQTLAVIIYKNKATKAEIDFIRGVESSRSIKNLLVRGIITRTEEKNKKYYFASTETLKYLNIDEVENIKDQIEIANKLKTLIEGE